MEEESFRKKYQSCVICTVDVLVGLLVSKVTHRVSDSAQQTDTDFQGNTSKRVRKEVTHVT